MMCHLCLTAEGFYNLLQFAGSLLKLPFHVWRSDRSRRRSLCSHHVSGLRAMVQDVSVDDIDSFLTTIEGTQHAPREQGVVYFVI